MADLTSDELFELTLREFKRILDADKRSRMQAPGAYKFGLALPESIRDESDKGFLGTGYLYKADWAQEIVDKAVKENRWPEFKVPVLDMLERLSVEIVPDSPEFSELCYMYATGLSRMLDIIQERERGNIEYNAEPFIDTATIAGQQAQPLSPSMFHTLSEVYRKYADERIKGEQWRNRTPKQNEEIFKRMLDHFGDIPVESITGDMMRGFKENLMSATSKSAKKTAKPLSPRTIKNILVAVAAFFNYAKSNKYIHENPAEGLTLKTKKSKGTSYEKFTSEDLGLIFTVAGLDGRSNTKPWSLWIPLLALFTGCRVEEIAQLLCTDVKCEDGVWYIDLIDSEDKSLKSESSRRKTPIHPFIIEELGFIKYVNTVRGAGNDRVFPELRKTDGRYGHAVSNWFNQRHLVKIGVKKEGDKKCFHSLRHTFITNLQHAGVNPYLIASIVGHEAGLITLDIYGQEYKLEQKLEAINKLDFGVDLTHLAKSRFIVR